LFVYYPKIVEIFFFQIPDVSVLFILSHSWWFITTPTYVNWHLLATCSSRASSLLEVRERKRSLSCKLHGNGEWFCCLFTLLWFCCKSGLKSTPNMNLLSIERIYCPNKIVLVDLLFHGLSLSIFFLYFPFTLWSNSSNAIENHN